MTHIVIDAHLAVKEIDGVSRYLLGLLTELPGIDRSIQYTVLCQPQNKSCFEEDGDIMRQSNVKSVELNLNGPSPRQHLVMRSLLKKLDADLYHHPQYDLPLGIATPSVVTIHDLKYILNSKYLKRLRWLKSLYIKNSLLSSIRRAAKAIVVSHSTLSDLKKLLHNKEYLSKFEVIPHGVELLNTRKNNASEYPMIAGDYILFVGTRRPHKNLEGLLKAFKILRYKMNLDFDLVISGKAYADYRTPEQTAAEIGVQEHVHFLDFMPDEQLSNLYRHAKLVVLPSFYEGFGLPLAEAMSYGTPVVGSNISSIPEVVGDAGLLADPYNPDDIADKITTILNDNRLYTKLSKAGITKSKDFSWSTVAQSTFNLYLNVLITKDCR
jgi:glycosyltransferase involved in cell wall biosynthesis